MTSPNGGAVIETQADMVEHYVRKGWKADRGILKQPKEKPRGHKKAVE